MSWLSNYCRVVLALSFKTHGQARKSAMSGQTRFSAVCLLIKQFISQCSRTGSKATQEGYRFQIREFTRWRDRHHSHLRLREINPAFCCYGSEEIDQRDLLFQQVGRLERIARKAENAGQFSAAVGAITALNRMMALGADQKGFRVHLTHYYRR